MAGVSAGAALLAQRPLFAHRDRDAPEASHATANLKNTSFAPLKQIDAGLLNVGFVTERGREGYDKYRRDFAKLSWQIASPKWDFDDATFDRTAAFVRQPGSHIVIHNYRWRLGLAEGEQKYNDLEKRLAVGPIITVPTITLEGVPMGRRIRTTPVPMPTSSPANMHTGPLLEASGTTCHKKLRRLSPRLLSMWTVFDQR